MNMHIAQKILDILAYDEETNTIFAVPGAGARSVVLDIIPVALEKRQGNPEYKQIYLTDHMGTEFIIPQGSTLEQAIDSWQHAVQQRRSIKEEPSQDQNPQQFGA